MATLQLLFLKKERHSGSMWTCLAKEEEEIMWIFVPTLQGDVIMAWFRALSATPASLLTKVIVYKSRSKLMFCFINFQFFEITTLCQPNVNTALFVCTRVVMIPFSAVELYVEKSLCSLMDDSRRLIMEVRGTWGLLCVQWAHYQA